MPGVPRPLAEGDVAARFGSPLDTSIRPGSGGILVLRAHPRQPICDVLVQVFDNDDPLASGAITRKWPLFKGLRKARLWQCGLGTLAGIEGVNKDLIFDNLICDRCYDAKDREASADGR